MLLFRKVKETAVDETGAVTVDWVMLTAALVGMVLALSATLDGGLASVAADINNAMRLETIQGASGGAGEGGGE